jgi:hypothetical protein
MKRTAKWRTAQSSHRETRELLADLAIRRALPHAGEVKVHHCSLTTTHEIEPRPLRTAIPYGDPALGVGYRAEKCTEMHIPPSIEEMERAAKRTQEMVQQAIDQSTRREREWLEHAWKSSKRLSNGWRRGPHHDLGLKRPVSGAVSAGPE